jgi:hypothetical protein
LASRFTDYFYRRDRRMRVVITERKPIGFYGSVTFFGVEPYGVYISLGGEQIGDKGYVDSDEFGVSDNDIFFYTQWQDVPSLFDGLEDWKLVSIDEMVFRTETVEGK